MFRSACGCEAAHAKARLLHLSQDRCKGVHGYAVVSDRLSGTIHSSISEMPYLLDLNLAGNRLSGTIEEGIWFMPSLTALDLSHNLLTGTISPSCGCVEQSWHIEYSPAQACSTVSFLSRVVVFRMHAVLASTSTLPCQSGVLLFSPTSACWCSWGADHLPTCTCSA